MPSARRSPTARDVLVCLAVLLCVRATLVFTLADCFFTGEELAHGTVSKALLDDLGIPLSKIIYVHYEGGGLLAGGVGALFFLAVGPTLLALKLTALVFDVANLLAGMFLAATFASRRAPLFFGLAYVLAPIACQQASLIDIGNHYLAISFFFLVLLFALRVLDRPAGERPRPRDCIGLGLFAGFGVWCSLMTTVVVAFVFVLLLASRRRVLDRASWSRMVLSFAVGAVPLWYMLAAEGMGVFDVHGVDARSPFGETPTRGEKADVLARAWAAMGPRGRVQCSLLAALPLLAFVGRRRRDGTLRSPAARRAWSVCGLFTAALLVVSLGSRFFPVDFHHYAFVVRLMPHAALLTLLSAGVLAQWVESTSPALRAVGWIVLGVQLSFGAWGTVELASAGKAAGVAEAYEVLTSTKGYDYGEYLPKLVDKYPPQDERPVYAAMRFDEPDPGLLYPSIASAVCRRLEPRSLPALREKLPDLDEESWHAFLRGSGRGLLAAHGGDFCASLRSVESAELPEGVREVLYEAIGRHGSGRHLRPKAFEHDLERAVACGAPAAFFRGYGCRVYRGHRIDRAGAERFLSRRPEGIRAPLREGYETGRRLHTVGD